MRIRLALALTGLAIGFVLPIFAQKDAIDPKLDQQIRALASKYDAAFNNNDAAAVAALYTEDGVNAFHRTSRGRQALEKSYAHDFERWHPNNHIVRIDRINAVGNDVRVTGRWNESHRSDINGAPRYDEGYFTWTIVREGDAWKIRKSTFSETSDPFSTNDG